MGDSEEETAEEKRLRLAKKYLEEIERQGINLLDVRLYYYFLGIKNTLFKYIYPKINNHSNTMFANSM